MTKSPPETALKKRHYPASKALAIAARKHALSHPWNRGFPNNKKLRELAAGKKE